MPVSIGGGPEHNFDQPLELLSDCHRRIERFLAVLSRVADAARGRALSEEESRSLTTALRYFREAAPRHTADEEESLFPRLRAHGGGEIAALEADHTRANQLHAEIDEIFSEWQERRTLAPGKEDRLRRDLAELTGLYSEHIRIEDQVVFPFAGRVLDKETRLAIGREMANRPRPSFLKLWGGPPAGGPPWPARDALVPLLGRTSNASLRGTVPLFEGRYSPLNLGKVLLVRLYSFLQPRNRLTARHDHR